MNTLRYILNIPELIFRALAFITAVVVCTAIHYIIALPLHVGSAAILFNANISRRLLAYSMGVTYKKFTEEIVGEIQKRDGENNDPR
jgi:hypothetical protein